MLDLWLSGELLYDTSNDLRHRPGGHDHDQSSHAGGRAKGEGPGSGEGTRWSADSKVIPVMTGDHNLIVPNYVLLDADGNEIPYTAQDLKHLGAIEVSKNMTPEQKAALESDLSVPTSEAYDPGAINLDHPDMGGPDWIKEVASPDDEEGDDVRATIEPRHLPGKHDQSTHGSGAGSKVGSYVEGSGTKDDPIRTNNVNAAAKALAEGKHVQLEQERMVSTLINKLDRQVRSAKAKGEDAPNINLCGVSVSGTNLFCAESKGVPRVRMPQLKGKPLPGTAADKLPKNDKGEVDLGPAFIEHLAKRGIKTTADRVPAEMLKASQNELNGAKVAGMTKAKENGTLPEGSIYVTRDDYVVDGHHRWAANVSAGISMGTSLDMPVEVIDADIITVLAAANNFTHSMGIPSAGVTAPSPESKGRSPLEALLATMERRHGKHNQKDHAGKGGGSLDDLNDKIVANFAGMSKKQYKKVKKKAAKRELKRLRKLQKAAGRDAVTIDDPSRMRLIISAADLRSHHGSDQAVPTRREDLGGDDRGGLGRSGRVDPRPDPRPGGRTDRRGLSTKEPADALACVECRTATTGDADAGDDDVKDTEQRSVPFELGSFEETRSTDGSPMLTFEGYAAVFNETAVVVDWRGQFLEHFDPRSFDRTVQLRSQANDQVRQIKFLFNHGQHPLISNMPIGQIRNLKPDSRGLHVRARMPVNWLNMPIIDGIRSKQITGMSINFIAEDEEWSTVPEGRSRLVKEATLLELGPVIDPVYTGTEVSLRSLGAHLREVAPDLFPSTGTPPLADSEGRPTLSTLDAYKRILSRR